MQILHVYKDYYPIVGGIENHMRTLAELQVQAGDRVTVLVTNPGDEPAEEEINGVRVLRAARLGTVASTPLSIALPFRLRALRPDITHLHFPYPVGELSQWLTGRGRPYVITYHSDVVRQKQILRFYLPLMRRVLARADRILPTSARYIATSPYLRPLAERCTVVPLSVDAAAYAAATAEAIAEAIAGDEPLLPRVDRPRLLFVGRHRYYKGVDTLIRAMPEIDAELVIAGDGPETVSWQRAAREAGAAERVLFLGAVSGEELPRLYAAASLFVLPANARAEAFGTVLLEAMAAGLPCITTEVGSGTSCVVQDGVTGLVVPPLDEYALRDAVNRLLADPALREQMGRAGRERVEAEFTPAALLSRVSAVYEQVLGRRRP